MKKAFLALGLLAGLEGVAQAQGIRVGVKAGASLTRLTGDAGPNYRPGFHGGLLANVGLTSRFSIQPEVLYSTKGRQSQPQYYLDVPVLARMAAGRTGLFFELGPQVGFLLAASNEYLSTPLDTKDGYHSVDFGYVGGFGYQAAGGLLLGLRYNGGFTSVYKPFVNYNGQTVQSDTKNSAFQLYAGYVFGRK